MSSRGHRLLAGSVVALSVSLALAGCSKAGDSSGNTSAAALPALPATLPMTSAPAQPAALAPAPAAIRAARPIRTVRVADPRAAYAYADQAGYFSQSLGDAPPDYGFDYDGVRPWAWQAYDGSRVFLEPVDGGYRSYYYRAGADRPYFVRDPDYAYGYDGDQLAAIYGPDGAILPYDDYGPRAGYAAGYLQRAVRLFEASRERQAISAAAWAARQNSIEAARERWAANRDRQAEWAAYHAEESAQQSRYWAEEAARRDADRRRFADWRQQDFRTPPPPRAIPPRWQQASWAQDTARYAPVAAAVAGGAALAVAAHDRQIAGARRDAARAQAGDVRQPPAPAPFGRPDARGGGADRPGPAGRPQHDDAGGPRSSSPQNADRPGFVDRGPSPHHRPAEAVRQQPTGPAAEPRRGDAAPRDAAGQDHQRTRPAERAVAGRPDDRAGFRGAPAGAPHGEQRQAATPRMNAGGSPPRGRSPDAARVPAAAPHEAAAAPQHGGGGDHPGGGRPAAPHPGGGGGGDHHH